MSWEGRDPYEVIGFMSGREKRASRNRAGLRALCQIATGEFCYFLLGCSFVCAYFDFFEVDNWELLASYGSGSNYM